MPANWNPSNPPGSPGGPAMPSSRGPGYYSGSPVDAARVEAGLGPGATISQILAAQAGAAAKLLVAPDIYDQAMVEALYARKQRLARMRGGRTGMFLTGPRGPGGPTADIANAFLLAAINNPHTYGILQQSTSPGHATMPAPPPGRRTLPAPPPGRRTLPAPPPAQGGGVVPPAQGTRRGTVPAPRR